MDEDCWIAIAVQTDEQWARIASLAGISRPAWQTLECRKRDEDAVETCIEEWTSRQSVDELEAALQRSGIPAHRVVSIEEFAKDPQVRARAHLVSLPHALSGTTVFESSPFVLQRTPAQYRCSAPFFGRDNTQILRETLGLDAEKIEELRQSGALT